MKYFCACLTALALCSCNTTIGVGRDIKQGFIWSKNKVQEKRAQSQQQNSYQDQGYQDYSGAPVY